MLHSPDMQTHIMIVESSFLCDVNMRAYSVCTPSGLRLALRADGDPIPVGNQLLPQLRSTHVRGFGRQCDTLPEVSVRHRVGVPVVEVIDDCLQ